MSYLKRLPARELLTGARTYYVATTGNDANDGLTAGTSFLTVQKAIDAAASIDTGIYDVTIQLADGTYTAAGNVFKPMTGAGSLTIQGNAGTPANVSVVSNAARDADTASGAVFYLRVYGNFAVKDMMLSSSGTGDNLLFAKSGFLTFANMVFGAAANSGSHVYAMASARIQCLGSYSITGGGLAHFRAVHHGYLITANATVTIANAVVFSYFVLEEILSYMSVYNLTFVNPANVTASKYYCDYISIIFTGTGGNANYFPGNSAGSSGHESYYN